ncbi:MAG: MBL fold metallo-hydrolase [Bacillota bacterium]
MQQVDFRIVFWGTRGSRPVSGRETLVYGGNTPCVQVQVGEKMVILDGGTGLTNLGLHLVAANKEKKPLKAHLFFSHVHWDHIQGLPFFVPAYHGENYLLFYGEVKEQHSFASIIKKIMSKPYFPIEFDELAAQKEIHEIGPQQELDLGTGVTVKTARNNHPSGCLSFRVEHGGRSCCYCTDTEHYPDRVDPVLQEFVSGTDVLIYDTNYTDDEYRGTHDDFPRYCWGHSTWQEGVKLARSAGVKKLVLFHHEATRSDTELARIEKEAQQTFPNCIAAREGLSLLL